MLVTEIANFKTGCVNKLHIYSEFSVSPNKVCLNKEFHLINEGARILKLKHLHKHVAVCSA